MNTMHVSSQRLNDRYTHDGYIYVRDKKSKDGTITFWRCYKKDTGKVLTKKRAYCNGRIWTDSEDGSFLALRVPHTCSTTGHVAQVEMAKINAAIKKQATESMEGPQEIRSKVLKNFSENILLPTTNATRKIIKRVRIRDKLSKMLRRQDLMIPIDYTRYKNNQGEYERFLIGDSGVGDEQRILIFGRECSKNWCGQIREIFLDGNFSLSPPLFSDIFTILARRDEGFLYPILFCLLPDKQKDTYIKLFKMIKEMWPEFKPEQVSADYKLEIHQALYTEFPEINIQGCYFYLMENLRKRLEDYLLIDEYNTNKHFALKARMIISVAFLPKTDVEYAIDALDEYLPPKLEPIFSWFIMTYIGRLKYDATRAAPLFPFNTWSINEKLFNCHNFEEECHKKLAEAFRISPPNFWEFIIHLRKIQRTFDAEYECFIAESGSAPKRIKSEVVDNYDGTNINIIEYLEELAQTIVLK